MNYGLIAICDKDSDYANSLADYFRVKGCLSSEIVVFTKYEHFSEFFDTHTLDILLINESFYASHTAISSPNLFKLCETRMYEEDEDEICLFKYTSAEELLREVMAHYKPVMNSSIAIPFSKLRKSKLIGIYSPVHRCGKSSFSLALALQHSLKYTCLFLSFDDYSSLRALSGEICENDKTIDDLLYYFEQSSDVFHSKLLSVIRHFQQLDYIAPSSKCCTICDISSSRQIIFLEKLMDIGRYEYIFVDFGSLSPIYPLLPLCSKLYVPYIENDCYSDYKLCAFKDSLKSILPDNSIPVEELPLPSTHYNHNVSEYIYSLTSGDMGRLTASLATQKQI